ncbi:TPA: hypothetical protein PNM84_001807 [Listeria monocytogenes]|nr:hypothetical protein [Listeria monocytogenes]
MENGEECYTEMDLDRTAIEELGKLFTKGFKVGFENIVIGNTQKSIDQMVNVFDGYDCRVEVLKKE